MDRLGHASLLWCTLLLSALQGKYFFMSCTCCCTCAAFLLHFTVGEVTFIGPVCLNLLSLLTVLAHMVGDCVVCSGGRDGTGCPIQRDHRTEGPALDCGQRSFGDWRMNLSLHAYCLEIRKPQG